MKKCIIKFILIVVVYYDNNWFLHTTKIIYEYKKINKKIQKIVSEWTSTWTKYLICTAYCSSSCESPGKSHSFHSHWKSHMCLLLLRNNQVMYLIQSFHVSIFFELLFSDLLFSRYRPWACMYVIIMHYHVKWNIGFFLSFSLNLFGEKRLAKSIKLFLIY